MDEMHKKILQRNRTNLVRDLKPSDLYDRLLEKGVFTQDMIDEIKVDGSPLAGVTYMSCYSLKTAIERSICFR